MSDGNPSTRRVGNVAPDQRAGMRLGDLLQFVTDAYSAGLTEDAQVRVQVGWRAQIRSATAEGVPSQELLDLDGGGSAPPSPPPLPPFPDSERDDS